MGQVALVGPPDEEGLGVGRVPPVGEGGGGRAHHDADHPEPGLLGPQPQDQLVEGGLGRRVGDEPGPGPAHRVGREHHGHRVGGRPEVRGRGGEDQPGAHHVGGQHVVPGRRPRCADRGASDDGAGGVDHGVEPAQEAAAEATRSGHRPASVASNTRPVAVGPASAATDPTRSARRAATTTRSPRRPRATATLRPMPDEAPTTRTRRGGRAHGSGSGRSSRSCWISMVLPAGSANQICTTGPWAPPGVGDAVALELGDGRVEVLHGEADVGAGGLDDLVAGVAVHQVELDVAGGEPVAVDEDGGAGLVGELEQGAVERHRLGQPPLDVDAVVERAGDLHRAHPSGTTASETVRGSTAWRVLPAW